MVHDMVPAGVILVPSTMTERVVVLPSARAVLLIAPMVGTKLEIPIVI